jgi:hypothetical protein
MSHESLSKLSKNRIAQSLAVTGLSLASQFANPETVFAGGGSTEQSIDGGDKTTQISSRSKITSSKNPIESFADSFAKTREYHVNHVHKGLETKADGDQVTPIVNLSSSLFVPWNSLSPLWSSEHFEQGEEIGNDPAAVLGNILARIESVPEVFMREELLEVACMYMLIMCSMILANPLGRKLVTGGGGAEQIIMGVGQVVAWPIAMVGEVQANYHKSKLFPSIAKHQNHFPLQTNSTKAIDYLLSEDNDLTPEARAKIKSYWRQIRTYIHEVQATKKEFENSNGGLLGIFSSNNNKANPELTQAERMIVKIIESELFDYGRDDNLTEDWHEMWADIEPTIRALHEKIEWQNIFKSKTPLPEVEKIGVDGINDPEVQKLMNPANYDLTTKQGKTDFINNAMIMRMLHGDKGINKTVVMTMLTKNRLTTAGLRKLEQVAISIEDSILLGQKPVSPLSPKPETNPESHSNQAGFEQDSEGENQEFDNIMDELNAAKAEGKRKAQEKQDENKNSSNSNQNQSDSSTNNSGQYSKKVFGAISKIRNVTNNIKVNGLMAPMFWFDEEYKEDMRKVKEARKSNHNSTPPKNNKPKNSNGYGNDRMMND